MKTYLIWLLGVIAWNYGFPSVPPVADVLMAILLSLMTMGIKRLIRVTVPIKKDS